MDRTSLSTSQSIIFSCWIAVLVIFVLQLSSISFVTCKYRKWESYLTHRGIDFMNSWLKNKQCAINWQKIQTSFKEFIFALKCGAFSIRKAMVSRRSSTFFTSLGHMCKHNNFMVANISLTHPSFCNYKLLFLSLTHPSFCNYKLLFCFSCCMDILQFLCKTKKIIYRWVRAQLPCT